MIPMSNLFELTEDYQIYCDMDGVLTHFNNGARKIGYKGPLPATGEDKAKLWSIVVNDAESFWGDMPWAEGGKKLWNFIKVYQPVLLTSISRDMSNKLGVNGKKGKQRWIKRELGQEYLTTALIVASGTKDKYVSLNGILIDDDKRNINQWKKAGGIGILHRNTTATIGQLRKLLNEKVV